jgi:uncharacterized membrane protein YgdD (TMEM256/DUF423 family)
MSYSYSYSYSFIFLGGLLAALGVGLGAIGAHALETRLTPEHMETYQTAVQYQMLHALGLVLVGLLHVHRPGRLLAAAGWAMLAGIILFSGFLFAWLATGQKWFVYPVPVGGMSFIVGWLMLAGSALGREG